MGRRTQVDYPVVPQSHQLQEQADGNYQTRYSWMDVPNSSARWQYTQNIQTQSQPQIQPQPQPVAYSIPEHPPIPSPIPLASISAQNATTKQQEAEKEWRNHNANVVSPPPPMPPSVGLQKEEQKESLRKPPKALNIEIATRWANLGPDENPLSPGVPAKTPPPAQQTTNIGVLPPQSMDFPAVGYQQVSQPLRGGEWQHGLYSCAEPAICMTGIFCPCMLYSRVQHRLALKREKKDASNLLGHRTPNGTCVAWTVLCGINGILSGIQRSRIRRSYEMDTGAGNCLGDCLVGCCCCCCVLAQNEKEVKYREEEGRKVSPSQPTGYFPPAGMSYAPQPR